LLLYGDWLSTKRGVLFFCEKPAVLGSIPCLQDAAFAQESDGISEHQRNW
jgi:hypothetical protein